MLDGQAQNGEVIDDVKREAKKGVDLLSKDVQFYESFTYNGVEYFLYDCVYVWNEFATESFIGKIVRIFGNSSGERKVKIVWFFRPVEIRNHLGDYEPRWNEIFLASGEGKGVANTNTLETIIRKCHVVCTSKDRRNPQASEEDLEKAEYFFVGTFDVGKLKILKNLPDQIIGIRVENFLNKRKDLRNSSRNLKPNVLNLLGKSGAFNKVHDLSVKDGRFASSIPAVEVKHAESNNATGNFGAQRHVSSESSPLRSKHSLGQNGVGHNTLLSQSTDKVLMKKVTVVHNSVGQDRVAQRHISIQSSPLGSKNSLMLQNAPEVQPLKKRKLTLNVDEKSKFDKAGLQHSEGRSISDEKHVDRASWLKQLPWEERLHRAQEAGTLVLLENLEPSFTYSDVKDLVLHAFNERVDAKMIAHDTFSSPHYGKAYVIFKSKEAADTACLELRKRCLMVVDGRPIVSRRGTLQNNVKPKSFTGHLNLSKIRQNRQSEEMRKAVSTSHCSQPNTVEYDMALQWRMLQEKSDRWWQRLHERQGREIDKVRSRLKVKHYG